MTFSLFKNLYSKEASGEISAQQLVEVIRSGVYRDRVERFRKLKGEGKKDEAAAVKRDMPAVTFSGVCKKGRSFELTTERTGWAMFDFDSLPPGGIAPLREAVQALPWVVMVFVTISGQGVRVVANVGMVPKAGYARAYTAAARELEAAAGAKPDMQCKDFARLSVISADPGIYYNPGAGTFGHVPPPPPPPPLPRARKGVDEILGRFFAKNSYVEGSRHHTLLKLGRYLRWWKLEPWEVETAIARVEGFATGNGVGAGEVRSAVRWGYDNGTEGGFRTAPGSTGFRVQYNNGISVKSPGPGQEAAPGPDEDEIMEASCRHIPDKVFDVLPDSLVKLSGMAKDKGERDMILLSAICMMSGVFSNLRTMYGNRLYSPHLFLAILAKAGTGKGVVAATMKLGDAINEKLEQRYAIEKEVYDKKLLRWELEKKTAMKEKRVPDISLCPAQPQRQMLKSQPNMSKSQFMLSMRNVSSG